MKYIVAQIIILLCQGFIEAQEFIEVEALLPCSNVANTSLVYVDIDGDNDKHLVDPGWVSLDLVEQVSNNKALLIYDRMTATTTWINYDGKVVKQLTFEQIPNLKGGKPQPLIKLFRRNNCAIHHFETGPLSIHQDGKWHLYNSLGIQVASLSPKYLELSEPSEGIFIATVIDSNGQNVQRYVNERGSELFHGMEFTHATVFRNDIAFARKDGEWFILNSKLQTLSLLETQNDFRILSIQRNSPAQSLAIVDTQDGQKKFLIDNFGRPTFSAKSCGGSATSNIATIDDRVIVCTNKNTAIFYDTTQRILLELDSVLSLDGVGGNLMLYRMLNGEKRLFDFQLNEVHLEVPDGYTVEVVAVSTRVIWATLMDTHSDKGFNAVFDIVSRKLVYQTARDICGFMGDRIIFSDWEGAHSRMNALSTLDGEILYIYPNKNQVYDIFLAKHLPKDSVQGVSIVSDEGLADLLHFSYVKSLEFKFCEFDALPQALCKFQNLEKMTVLRCDQLVEIPGCMNHLPKLTYLQLTECERLTGIENFLRARNTGLTVATVGYKFENGFSEFIKTEKPYIKLSSWSGIQAFNNK